MEKAEIPGFRYDPTSNRYFRLRPGELPPAKRQKVEKKEVKREKMSPITSLLDQAARGPISPLYYQRKCITTLIQQNTDQKKDQSAQLGSDSFANHAFLAPLPSSPFLLQWTNRSYTIIANYYIASKSTLAQETVLSVSTGDSVISQAGWGHYEKPYFMIGFTGHGNSSGCCKIYDFVRIPGDEILRFETKEVASLYAYKKSLFSCHWLHDTTTVSLGVTKGCVLLDVPTTKIVHRYKVRTDVLYQTSSKQHLIFNGTRGGRIWTIDTRQQQPARIFGPCEPQHCSTSSPFYNHVNPTKLKLLSDENYLLASYSNGQVLLWDRRKNDCLQSYGSNIKSFCLNDAEDLMFAVNEERKLEIWDLWPCRLADLSSPLPIPFVPNTITYNEYWPLYSYEDRRMEDGDNQYYQPAICSSLPYSQSPLYTHLLLPHSR